MIVVVVAVVAVAAVVMLEDGSVAGRLWTTL